MAGRKSSAANWLLILGVFRFLWRYPLFFLLILVLMVGAAFLQSMRPVHAYLGVPVAVNGSHIDTWFRILRNRGYMVGYSDWRGNPLWVIYRLSPVPEDAQSDKRPSRFDTDWRAINRVSHDSYTRGGYDRGHMAPNRAMNLLYGQEGQQDSFLMTNITPQKPALNQKIWKYLEDVEIKNFTQLSDKIWVLTGPIFTGSRERLSSSWTVEIPDAFYKIYIMEPKGQEAPKMLGFIIPQTVKGKEPLKKFVRSIDEIEAQTGLDFFSPLDDKTEARLEAKIDLKPWGRLSVN